MISQDKWAHHQWRFLLAGGLIVLVSQPLGYAMVLTLPFAAGCFILSLASGIRWQFTLSSGREAPGKAWLIYLLSFVAACLTLFFLLRAEKLYRFYFGINLLFTVEILALACFTQWRRSAVPVITLAGCWLLPLLIKSPTTVRTAIAAGDETYLSFLLAFGADPSQPDYADPPLEQAIETGRLHIIRRLLQEGADPNGKSNHFDTGTPVMFRAVWEGKEAVVRLLLAYGAHPDERDKFGVTALTFAVRHNQPRIANLLLRQGSAVDARDHKGRTALFSAPNPAMVQLLLANGANPHLRDYQGRTILFGSVDYLGSPPARALLEAILAQGVEVNATDHSGQTALDVAMKNGHQGIAAFLRAKGAHPGVSKTSP